MEKRFQSTLPTRGSDSDIVNLSLTLVISIHAPHEGERLDELQDVDTEREISIHAPHEGERRSVCNCVVAYFLDFNPRSPRGGATESYSSFIFII